MSGLKSAYEEFIFVGHYAREKQDGTRESWSEAVNRYLDFVIEPGVTDRDELYNAIYNCEVMPSMRALMTAGAAAKRDAMCIYNCAYVAVDKLRVFPEILYVLMSGTGVGFSCQSQYVEQLPVVPAIITPRGVHKVGDSKQGWAEALEAHINSLWKGNLLRFDYSDVRPPGAPLKIMGGRASGPEPLKQLIDFVTRVVTGAPGRRLTTAEVNDLVCNIAEIVVVGGVRRSALISLTDLNDTGLRNAKSGQWWKTHKWLALENISAVYNEKPDAETFLDEWLALIKSHSGERGIFNSQAAIEKVKSIGRRKHAGWVFGTNPCSEIILRSCQVCNLTEVVLRPNDDYLSVQRKVKIATILGTLQSRFTNFPYLSAQWKQNCEEERLLGVSMTGIWDNAVFSDASNPALPQMLESLRRYAVAVNAKYAHRLGINASTAITCVKPSGTVSQLVDSASGIHPRWSEYYIRTVRIDKKDPLYEFMKKTGVPCEDENGHPDSTAVLSFPQRAEGHRGLRANVTALQQLHIWQIYNQHWCEHKPSATIYVRPHEWVEVGNWVYEHFDAISGVSFLPYDNGTYKQAPYQEITAEAYTALKATQPKIDWKQFKAPKKNNRFTFACGGAGCELVDLGGAATE
jgi:ribonucleoside-triphosphate reductase (thioredoxin)